MPKSRVRKHKRRKPKITGYGVLINRAADLNLLNKTQTCQLIGGNGAPINGATLYRGIAAGRYPKPIHISPGLARWSLAELEAALRKIIVGRTA